MNRGLLCVGLLLACATARGADAASAARALGGAFAGVYDKVAPSVVVLEVAKDEGASGADAAAWEFLFRDQQAPDKRPRVEESEGSGFIIREDGYILTNAHVVEGADPERGVVARRQDGTRLPLRVVGVDDKTDLAVLKADAKGLPTVEWGDSDALRVGEFVCAIGAPFELDYTLTVGVLSAKGRSNLTSTVYEDYLQTDTAINPGNSGGPLCDLDGRVVGVNTLINGISRGLSFAIPARIARTVSEELIASGRVVRPWLGIRIETLGENAGLQQMMGIDKGVLVRTIEPDAPAARSELQPADVIVAVDGEPVSTARDLQQVILRKRVGQEVGLKVWRRGLREGAFREIKVTTDELPQSPLIASGGRTAPPRAERRGDEEGGDGSFGLRIQDIPEAAAAQMGLSAPGVIVTGVEEGSPADLAGLLEKDVITAVGSTAVRDTEAFAAAMQDLGDSAAVLLLEREGKKTYAILKP